MRDLMRLGMDVARLNFSHGSHAEHARTIERLRGVAERERRSICILQDLQGPKMRTARLQNHRPVLLEDGSRVTLTPRDIPGTGSLLSTTVPTLARDVRAGMDILLDDGRIALRVLRVRGDDVECEVVNGGLLGEHKGINIPGAALSLPSVTGKDEKDLLFGLKHGVDAVALSFVRTGADVVAVRKLIGAHDSDLPVIAKIEKPQAIEHLEEILEVADGVMVARGDLGVEMPPEKVPLVQKHIIRRAADWRKPVITATQMLESMVANPRPTRAEASDVANAILDGTDAVMLSAETASGKHPREAVSIMHRIIMETEEGLGSDGKQRRRHKPNLSISETICESVAHAAEDLDMRAIGVFTATGTTARLISEYRPKARIFAFAHVPAVRNRMNLYWGVTAMPCQQASGTDDMLRVAEDELMRIRAVAPGDVLGIVAGTQAASGSTNFMRLHVVGADDGTMRSVPRTAGTSRVSARTRRAR
jgi:pyruvate kinase